MGDIESLPFLEAIRQFPVDVGRRNCMFIHLTLVPYIGHAGELKTKPTQHSVNELRRIGIQPDMLICRSEAALVATSARRSRCSRTCRSRRSSPRATSTTSTRCRSYFRAEGVDDFVLDHFGMEAPRARPRRLGGARAPRATRPSDHVRIAIVGKYVQLEDAYLSVSEALRHAGFMHGCTIEIDWIDSERLDARGARTRCSTTPTAILVPGGFGGRGIEGKIRAARVRARERASRTWASAWACRSRSPSSPATSPAWTARTRPSSTPRRPFPVIDLLPEQKEVARPGRHDAAGRRPDQAARRHARARDLRRGRHLRAPPPPLRGQQPPAQAAGERGPDRARARRPTSGWSRSSSSPDHPFFVASQYHPEFKSRPERPAPLFRDFVGAALNAGARRPSARRSPGEATRATRSAARLNGTFETLCAIASPSGQRAGVRGLRDRRAAGAGPRGRGGRREGNLLDPDLGADRADGGLTAVRAPRHGRAAGRHRPGRGGGRRWENANDGDPRRRQQGRGRGDARGRPARARATSPRRSRSSCCSPSARRSALAGAKAFDASTPAQPLRLRLRPRDADRRDRSSPRRPTYRLEADFHGAAAHAGIRPEDGRNAIVGRRAAIAAMPLGRLDAETTVERRRDPGRHAVGQRRGRALPARRPRRARSTPTRAEDARRRAGRPRPRRRQRRRVRRRRRWSTQLFERLPPQGRGTRRAGGRGGARGAAASSRDAHRHRRRQATRTRSKRRASAA